MNELTFRAATVEDFASICTLLEANNLPTADLADSRPEFIVVEYDATLIGVAGLQRFGEVALVRSIAIAERNRGTGLGARLIRELERLATTQGVGELVLLTETAENFFARHGFRKSDRGHLPPKILATAEFRSLCPASATCMTKRLDGVQERS